MSRNPLGVVSGVGAGAERSGGERSEPQRSGAPVPTEVVPAASHPNPEVVARPQRRSYTRGIQSAHPAAKRRRLPPSAAGSAPFFAVKVCTPRCWSIGDENSSRGFGRP